MKTLADFKRDAASGKIKLEMVERFRKNRRRNPGKVQRNQNNSICKYCRNYA